MTTPYNSLKVLVVGYGSIGARHAGNLQNLGVRRLFMYDPEPERVQEAYKNMSIEGFTSYEQALEDVEPDAVLVCSPPVYHVDQALMAISSGADVFIEKPLSHSRTNVKALMKESETRKGVVQVGYNFRFHPGFLEVKRLVNSGIVGKTLWARAEFGQYLPDWRPQRDYRSNYTARRELGGGIILDASHEIDYLMALLGQAHEVTCVSGHSSSLDVSTEDHATLIMTFEGDVHGEVHADFIQRSYSRSFKLVGERGTIEWDYTADLIKVYDAETGSWERHEYPHDANSMYVEEIRSFLDSVITRNPPEVGLTEGARVLNVALAALESAESGRKETVMSWI